MAQYIHPSSPDPWPENGDSSPASVVFDLTDARAETSAVAPATTVVDWPTPAPDERGSAGKRRRDANIEEASNVAKSARVANIYTKLRGALLCSYAQDVRDSKRIFVIEDGHECFADTPITITCSELGIKVECMKENGFVRLFCLAGSFWLETQSGSHHDKDRRYKVDFTRDGFNSLSLAAEFISSVPIEAPEFMDVFDRVQRHIAVKDLDSERLEYVQLEQLHQKHVIPPSWTGWAADQLGFPTPLSAFEDSDNRKHKFTYDAAGKRKTIDSNVSAGDMIKTIDQQILDGATVRASINFRSVRHNIPAASTAARGMMYAMCDSGKLRRIVAEYVRRRDAPSYAMNMIWSAYKFTYEWEEAVQGGAAMRRLLQVSINTFKGGEQSIVTETRIIHNGATTAPDGGNYNPDTILRLLAMNPRQPLTVACITAPEIVTFLNQAAFGCLTLSTVLQALEKTTFTAKGSFTAIADAINRAILTNELYAIDGFTKGEEKAVFVLLKTLLLKQTSVFVEELPGEYVVKVPEELDATYKFSSDIVVRIPKNSLRGMTVTLPFDQNYNAAVPSQILAIAILDTERIIDPYIGESGPTPMKVLMPGAAGNGMRLANFNVDEQENQFALALEKIPVELRDAYMLRCEDLGRTRKSWTPLNGGWPNPMLVAALQTAADGVWFASVHRNDHLQDLATTLEGIRATAKGVATTGDGGLVIIQNTIHSSAVLINEIKSQIADVARQICVDTPGAVVYGGILSIPEHVLAFTICDQTGVAVTCNSYGEDFEFGAEQEFLDDHVEGVMLLVSVPRPNTAPGGPRVLQMSAAGAVPGRSEQVTAVYLSEGERDRTKWQKNDLIVKHFKTVTDARTPEKIKAYLLELYDEMYANPSEFTEWQEEHGGHFETNDAFIAHVVSQNFFRVRTAPLGAASGRVLGPVVKVDLCNLLDRKFKHTSLIRKENVPAYHAQLQAAGVHGLVDNRCSPGVLAQAGGSCWFAAAMTLLARCGKPLATIHGVNKDVLLYATMVYNCSYQIQSAQSVDQRRFAEQISRSTRGDDGRAAPLFSVRGSLNAAFADLAC